MPIKKSNYSKQENAVDILKSKLDNISNEILLDNLPQEMRKKFENFKLEIDQHEPITEENFQKLTGKVETQEEVLALIIQATGYTKWEFDQKIKLTKKQIDLVKKAYGISFSMKEIYEYVFTRETSNPKMINMLTITVLPSHFDIYIESERTGFSIDELMTNEEAIEKLKQYFS